ncbi:peptidylprolyl isomerase [Betaproteobacteria bacterium GR16-43]|nr:peptidylprolyl isomerase [Betaproteobacteria bacterium GR16-43]
MFHSRKSFIATLLCASALVPAVAAAQSPGACAAKLKASKTLSVTLTTSMGPIVLALDSEKAPLTVVNFATYVDAGQYNGTIFHRVINGFMIQGGGFTKDMNQKATRAPVKNEAGNGLKNDTYTIAMARTQDPDSATGQFFINVKDNDMLNRNPSSAGYAVFGKVTSGQDTVDKIKAVPTGNAGGHQNVPTTPVVIEKAECL